MAIFVALLRGINVGARKIIKMEDLRTLVERIGYFNVRTYIQSGNVVFESAGNSVRVFENEIQKKIKKKYGFDVIVIVKDAKQMKKILASNPFIKEKDETKKYVTILSAKPDKLLANEFEKYTNGVDKFVLKGDVVYTMYGEGYGKSDFSNNFIEKKLKISATTRNWNTMSSLLEMMKS